MDYAAWVHRAKCFVRRFALWPGVVHASDSAEPPASHDAYSLEWLRSPECSLVSKVKRFITEGSARCCLHYEWKPVGNWYERLGAILPEHPSLLGGGDLCEAARYSNYDHRDRLRELEDESARMAQDLLSEHLDDGLMDVVWAAMNAHSRADEALRERGLLTLFPTPSIVLNLESSKGRRRVVYTSQNSPHIPTGFRPDTLGRTESARLAHLATIQ